MSNIHFDIAGEHHISVPDLLYISHSRYEGDWNSIMHSHVFSELLYIEKGEGEILIRNTGIPVRERDFILLPPNFSHTEISSEEDRLEYYALGVSNLSLAMYETEDEYRPIIRLGSENDRVRSLIRNMVSELRRRGNGFEIMVRAYFLELMAILLRTGRDALAVRGHDEQAKGKMNRIRDYIDSHYMEDLTLDGIASMFHVSKYHLVREFSKAFSMTPYRYLEEIRVRIAKNLLSSTEHRITDIAMTIGYSSSSYFSQRFRSLTGITPLDYRQMSRERDIL